jgi:hypothetical protein
MQFAAELVDTVLSALTPNAYFWEALLRVGWGGRP